MRPAILLFGDSLTELAFGDTSNGPSVGWSGLLAAEYTRRADVFNRGFRGYNTRMALEILPNILTPELCQHKMLFCTVYFGANDSVLEGKDPRHVPIEEFKQNLVKIVDTIRDKFGDIPIILMTPPPLDEEARKKFCLAEYGDLKRAQRTNSMSKRYSEAIKEVAETSRCLVLDVFVVLKGDEGVDNYKDYLIDGLHLTEAGNINLYNALIDLVRSSFPKIAPSEGGIPRDQKEWEVYL